MFSTTVLSKKHVHLDAVCTTGKSDDGHMKFTAAGQKLVSSSTVTINADVSFSLWIKRASIGTDMYFLNVGNTGLANNMVTMGYRASNTFTFAL
jgi:hypothetical protein